MLRQTGASFFLVFYTGFLRRIMQIFQSSGEVIGIAAYKAVVPWPEQTKQVRSKIDRTFAYKN